MYNVKILLSLLPLLLLPGPSQGQATGPSLDASLRFQDVPLAQPLDHPDWFKESFLDLRADVREAVAEGKRGLVLYFGQAHCAYCKALLDVNFAEPDILAYTRAHFDVVGIDIWGAREVTDMFGVVLTEKDYAAREGLQFTPTLVFFDEQGDEVMRLRGYYPPYQFRAALEYVADRHYRRETFRDYLARAQPGLSFEPEELVEEDFFEQPPYMLDRSRFPAQRPLVVLFEQGHCHACDILHGEQLRDPGLRALLGGFDVVQLHLWGDTPVVTPGGERTTSGRWARDLGLFYAPTLLFFDEKGREIIRVDSVVRFHRLQHVLEFIASGDYRDQPSFLRWREGLAAARDPG